ncbi:TPA: hypothetical protein ACH3X1_008641 [Trebouxia sp. C0004]
MHSQFGLQKQSMLLRPTSSTSVLVFADQASRGGKSLGRTASPQCKDAMMTVCNNRSRTSLSKNRHQQGLTTVAAVKQTSGSTKTADYFSSDDRPVILFDGVCNLCNGAVNFLLDWDKKGQYRLAALQSKAGSDLLQQAGRKPGDLSSVVLVEPGHAYVKSEAVLRIGRRLNTPFYVLGSIGLPVPSFIRDAAYDLVAKTRYKVFGKTESCRMCDPSFRERFIES